MKLTTQMLRGARTGAVYGGLSGAGEGEGLADKITKGTTGVVTGGTVGAVAPAVVEGVVRGGRAVAEPVANTIRGIRDTDAEAARRITTTLARDAEVDQNFAKRMAPGEFLAAAADGKPVMVTDLGGEATRALARSAANTSPEARHALETVIDDRFKGQTGRLTSWLEDNFNHPDADALHEAIVQAARRTNDPAYTKLMAAHPVVNVPEEITKRPAVAQAMKDAVSLAKNYGEKLESAPETRTIISGPGYHIADDLPGEQAKKSLRYWDYVKKAMDARLEGMKRKGGLDELNGKEIADFRGLKAARDALVENLDAAAPEYKAVRAGAARYFGAEDALEAGRQILKSRTMTDSQIVRGLEKMTPGERKLAQDGFISEFVDMLRNHADRRDVLNRVAESPNARARLQIMLGPQKAKEFEAALRVEELMNLGRSVVKGNSTTTRQLAELTLAGGTGYGLSGGGVNPFDSPGALFNAALVAGSVRGKQKINEALSKRVGEMLASADPRVIRSGIKAIAENKQLFNSLRNFDLALSRGAARFTPAPQITGAVSRADDQQNAPRPPNK